MSKPTYELKVSNAAATCVYLDEGNVAEIKKMRGNFWKTFGYFHCGRNLLHPEEALYLLEKGNITIEEFTPIESLSSQSLVSSESNPNPSIAFVETDIIKEKETAHTEDDIPVLSETNPSITFADTGTVTEEEVAAPTDVAMPVLSEPNSIINASETDNITEIQESMKEEEASVVVSQNKRIHFPSFYEKIVDLVGLPFYLVYSKLKVCTLIINQYDIRSRKLFILFHIYILTQNLDYIVLRHSSQPVHFQSTFELDGNSFLLCTIL